MGRLYFTTRDGSVTVGPLSGDELRQRARLGQLLPGDLVYSDGWAKWMRADELPGLLDAPEPFVPPLPVVAPPPPLPPPPPPAAPRPDNLPYDPVATLSVVLGCIGLLPAVLCPLNLVTQQFGFYVIGVGPCNLVFLLLASPAAVALAYNARGYPRRLGLVLGACGLAINLLMVLVVIVVTLATSAAGPRLPVP